MISLCLPTRGRPEAFKNMYTSAIELADNPNDLEFISFHDDDDRSVYEYHGYHKVVVGKRDAQPITETWNICVKEATGDLFLFIMDDAVFYTKGWDTATHKAFDESDDKIIFAYYDDQYYRSNHGSVFCVHKNWIDAVGYLAPHYFTAHFGDGWVNAVADKIKRKVFLRHTVVKHHSILKDLTHLEHMERKRRDDPKSLFIAKEEERVQDAQKLQDFINNFKK